MVLHDYKLKIPMHDLIVVGEGARTEVRSNSAPSMLHGALRFFIESLQCSCFVGLAYALGVAIFQVVVRITVLALSGKTITLTAQPGLGHRCFR